MNTHTGTGKEKFILTGFVALNAFLMYSIFCFN